MVTDRSHISKDASEIEYRTRVDGKSASFVGGDQSMVDEQEMRANISQGPVNADVSQGRQSKHGTEIAGIANKSGIFGSDNASNNLNATPREGLG